MNNSDSGLLYGERRIEKGILIVYSLYTISMAIVSIVLNWDYWILPLIMLGMLANWGFFVKKYRDYRFRALAVSCAALLNFVLYGVNAEDFLGILSTMGALVILLGIYGIKEIVYLSFVGSAFLLFWHGCVIHTLHVPTDLLKFCQMMLQIFSIFTIEAVTYYLVKSQISVSDKFLETIQTLKMTEKSKDNFMANVSHEIRTPINAINGISEMILREDIPDSIRDDVQDIQMSGRNLLGIVSDVLDFSELQMGKIELVEEPYNITSTINDVINMAVAKKGNKPIEIVVDCDADIPGSLLGDEQKIRRVMTKLINNAIKFTEEGCIVFRISARREEYGINLSVSVKDTGIGIKEENLEKIFGNFNQVDTEKNRQEGGIGLGLAISQAIVQKMNGFISVHSTFGEGTEIRFVIPQRILEDTPAIKVEKPEEIRVVFCVNLEKDHGVVFRSGYEDLIRHISTQLGTPFIRCSNLEELKRRIEKERFTHVFLNWSEYVKDKAYYDSLAEEKQVILIKADEPENQVGAHIKKIYKPFYALSVAAVLNSEKTRDKYNMSFYAKNVFTAPTASALVVDDNLMNLKVAQGLLRPYKIKVFTAESGQEALDKINNMSYDFVFMDHMMPGMDGVEVLHRIRNKPGKYFQDVPIIALTANAIGGAREMFLEEGFQDFVAKPIEQSALDRVLRKFIPETKIVREVLESQEDIPTESPDTDQIDREDTNSQCDYENIDFPGIDVKKGIAYCGGLLEDYLDIVKLYLESGDKNCRTIQQYYEKQDWKNYAIQVHALKSNSYGIGADRLGDLAYKLELAGKENDEAFIRENHDSMMKAYKQILTELKKDPRINSAENDEPKGQTEEEQKTSGIGDIADCEQGSDVALELTKQQWESVMNQLDDKMQSFESDGVSQLRDKLIKCQYKEQKVVDLLNPVMECVRDFDFLGAKERLDDLREKMR